MTLEATKLRKTADDKAKVVRDVLEGGEADDRGGQVEESEDDEEEHDDGGSGWDGGVEDVGDSEDESRDEAAEPLKLVQEQRSRPRRGTDVKLVILSLHLHYPIRMVPDLNC